MYAYEQSLLCYAYCPDLWYEAAAYLQRASESGVRHYVCVGVAGCGFTSTGVWVWHG